MIRPCAVICCVICLVAGAAASEANETHAMLLRENWFIQSSAHVQAEGTAISTVGFRSNDWYPATVPATVLSALVEDKVYPDPYTGMNLRSIPGTSYPIFEDFSNIMMPPASPFVSPGGIALNFDSPQISTGGSSGWALMELTIERMFGRMVYASLPPRMLLVPGVYFSSMSPQLLNPVNSMLLP